MKECIPNYHAMLISKKTISHVRKYTLPEAFAKITGQEVIQKRDRYLASTPFSRSRGLKNGSPSFDMKQDSDGSWMWICRTTKRGGRGALSFYREYAGLTSPSCFREAIESLADILSIQVEYGEGTGGEDNVDPAFKINSYFQHSFSSNLKRHRSPGAHYLEVKREISPITCEHFGIGYCGWDQEVPQEFKIEDLLDLDIMRESQSSEGRMYPTFGNRVTFPFRDTSGKITGFCGRSVDPRSQKHMNTRETRIYKKGNVFFGLYENRNNIRKSRRGVLVEGQMDVAGMWEAGIDTCACPGGTALSGQQARAMRLLSDRWVLMWEADSYEQDRWSTAVCLMVNAGIDVWITKLPSEEEMGGFKVDPDSLRKHYPDQLKSYLKDNTMGLIKFAALRIASASGRDRISRLEYYLGMFGRIQDSVIRESYLSPFCKHLMERYNYSQVDLMSRVPSAKKDEQEPGAGSSGMKGTPEYRMVHYLVHDPDLYQEIAPSFEGYNFLSQYPELEDIWQYIGTGIPVDIGEQVYIEMSMTDIDIQDERVIRTVAAVQQNYANRILAKRDSLLREAMENEDWDTYEKIERGEISITV